MAWHWRGSAHHTEDHAQPREHVNPFSVYKVLRELVSLMAGVRAEVRFLRKENEARHREVIMAFSDLQTNVAQLITLAEAAAAAAAAKGGTGASSTQIDALNSSVVDALHVLTPPVAVAAAASGTQAPPPAPAAPPSTAAAPAVAAAVNAAATSAAGNPTVAAAVNAAAAPASSGVAPASIDPNAPATTAAPPTA